MECKCWAPRDTPDVCHLLSHGTPGACDCDCHHWRERLEQWINAADEADSEYQPDVPGRGWLEGLT